MEREGTWAVGKEAGRETAREIKRNERCKPNMSSGIPRRPCIHGLSNLSLLLLHSPPPHPKPAPPPVPAVPPNTPDNADTLSRNASLQLPHPTLLLPRPPKSILVAPQQRDYTLVSYLQGYLQGSSRKPGKG